MRGSTDAPAPRSFTASVPARILVTDAQDTCGLAVVRCLGTAGHHVTAASLGWEGLGLWSRHAARRRILPDPRDSVDAFSAGLERLLSEEPQDFVIPGRDETAYAISLRREAISGLVQTGLPDHAIVERALDKESLATAAASVGLSAPEQRVCRNAEDALEAARTFGWPVLVKPVATCFELDGRVARHPSRWVAGEAELRDIQSEIGTCIVQRRVKGRVLSFGGTATEHGVIGYVVSRYLRTWPREAGQSSYTESIEPPPGLVERVQALVAAIGWIGIFELELIERQDGMIHAIDFNPRPYASIGLARAVGVPLSSLWCESLTGQSPASRSADVGTRFRNEVREMNNIKQSMRNRDYRAAAAVLRPHPSTVHAIFQRADPSPSFAYGIFSARRKLVRRRPG